MLGMHEKRRTWASVAILYSVRVGGPEVPFSPEAAATATTIVNVELGGVRGGTCIRRHVCGRGIAAAT